MPNRTQANRESDEAKAARRVRRGAEAVFSALDRTMYHGTEPRRRRRRLQRFR
jgi:hypothetical protein